MRQIWCKEILDVDSYRYVVGAQFYEPKSKNPGPEGPALGTPVEDPAPLAGKGDTILSLKCEVS